MISIYYPNSLNSHANKQLSLLLPFLHIHCSILYYHTHKSIQYHNTHCQIRLSNQLTLSHTPSPSLTVKSTITQSLHYHTVPIHTYYHTYSPHPHYKTSIILQNSFPTCSCHLHNIHTHNEYPHHLCPHTHTCAIPHWQSETAFSQHTLYSTTPLRHSWFPCSKWSCYHSLLSGMLTICPHKLVTLLIAPRITYKHTNALTISLPPCTYLLPSHYIFPIPSTVYILLLLLEMPHPHFQTHKGLNVSLTSCPFSLLSLLPYSFTHPFTCTILIFYSMTYTVSLTIIITYILILSCHYHSHCPTSLPVTSNHPPLLFTLSPLPPWSHKPWHCTTTLSHCHSILFPFLHQIHSSDQPQFYTWCQSTENFLISSFFPFLSLLSCPHTTTLPIWGYYMNANIIGKFLTWSLISEL